MTGPRASSDPVALEVIVREPQRMQRERLALLIGAGLASGLALATLSPRQWSRLGALLFGAGAWLLRSPVGPALLAAILARATTDAGDGRVIDADVHPASPRP